MAGAARGIPSRREQHRGRQAGRQAAGHSVGEQPREIPSFSARAFAADKASGAVKGSARQVSPGRAPPAFPWAGLPPHGTLRQGKKRGSPTPLTVAPTLDTPPLLPGGGCCCCRHHTVRSNSDSPPPRITKNPQTQEHHTRKHTCTDTNHLTPKMAPLRATMFSAPKPRESCRAIPQEPEVGLTGRRRGMRPHLACRSSLP